MKRVVGYIALVAVTAACVMTGCSRRKPEPIRKPEKPKPIATGVAKGVSISGNDSKGRPLYEISIPGSTQSGVDASATLTGARVRLYHEGVPDLDVSAPKARLDGKTKEIIVWGGITARSNRTGAAFTVERMTWNADSKVFRGTGGVRYTRPPVSVRCDSLSGTIPVRRISLDGNVRLLVKP